MVDVCWCMVDRSSSLLTKITPSTAGWTKTPLLIEVHEVRELLDLVMGSSMFLPLMSEGSQVMWSHGDWGRHQWCAIALGTAVTMGTALGDGSGRPFYAIRGRRTASRCQLLLVNCLLHYYLHTIWLPFGLLFGFLFALATIFEFLMKDLVNWWNHLAW